MSVEGELDRPHQYTKQQLLQQRDDLLAALEKMIWKGCRCGNCKGAKAAIAKAGGGYEKARRKHRGFYPGSELEGNHHRGAASPHCRDKAKAVGNKRAE